MKLCEHNTNKEVYTQIEATPERDTGGSNIQSGEESKGGKIHHTNTIQKYSLGLNPHEISNYLQKRTWCLCHCNIPPVVIEVMSWRQTVGRMCKFMVSIKKTQINNRQSLKWKSKAQAIEKLIIQGWWDEHKQVKQRMSREQTLIEVAQFHLFTLFSALD